MNLIGANSIGDPFNSFDATLQTRRGEADAFDRSITPGHVGEDGGSVLRQALAGM